MADSAQNGSRERVLYAVLGCGSTGYHVLQELQSSTGNVLVIDKNEDRVRELRDQRIDAVRRDIFAVDFLSGIPAIEIAFVLTGDNEANLAAVKALRETYPHSRIMARASDPLVARNLEEAGADFVLNQNQLMAKAAVYQINKVYANRVSQRLYSLLSSWEGTLGIITHKNPDPDAISSALALAVIAKNANPNRLVCRIFYDGIIGHQANRTLVNLLEIKMEKMDPAVLQECTYLALVDSPAPGVNNTLPPKTRVHIVIDHHEDGKLAESPAVFVDSRPGIGATASILSQYLQELDIGVDKRVATGLLYGIRSDTRDFSRNVTPQDLINAAFLLPLTDNSLLDQIMSPSLSEETLDILGIAIANRKIQSGYLFSNVGFIRNRDALPQAADLLITLEGVNTALIYGISDEAIIMSARNRDVRLHIGNVLKEAFGTMGEAGGHPTMAAAVIPLSFFSLAKSKADLLSLVTEPLLGRFANIVGLESEVRNGI
ncbi:MAG TPA: DHH family phosphoesterase [Methanoregulaceae archaeon]|nr:MAG: putative manganese-dependent inorganic pyrophosphatase [Euryarchaeota archaeon ADurb.BinA087]HNQ30799.1 DHH family phosphoesterase [Methanolinea sp.]HPH34596.1 DHH family phosphoesterase [Methanoregulaceae archaeon]